VAGSYSTPGVESKETRNRASGMGRWDPNRTWRRRFVLRHTRATRSAADTEDGPALPALKLPKVIEHGNLSERRSCSLCGMAAKYRPAPPNHRMYRVECHRCGTCVLDDLWTATELTAYNEKLYLASGCIREHTDTCQELITLSGYYQRHAVNCAVTGCRNGQEGFFTHSSLCSATSALSGTAKGRW